ncbi:hypothetical protein J2128_000885 [Methanomicrobium sp. W14]|uniref:KEOPS complex subunit Pcc1 n=1 Tax=Methanomicrobium sp. W14 TaxID=2817839 RepID=UPI001AE19848|nr:KEOPS complex subunit Pcc1 [Methanomicrobium sp. W14]MBP2132964.1 hypothetical protein [Methanomicrobium sp. W14]
MIKITGTITTYHKNPLCISESLKADNLRSMNTEVSGKNVICRIKNDKLRSVVASVDDYMMNLSIADEICGLVPVAKKRT